MTEELAQNPSELLPILALICGELNPDGPTPEGCDRKIQFMIYELKERLKEKDPTEQIRLLSDFLLKDKGFTLIHEKFNERSLNSQLLNTALKEKEFSPELLAILLSSIGYELELDIRPLKPPLNWVIKFCHSGKSTFFNMAQGGDQLNEQDLIQIINLHLDESGHKCTAFQGIRPIEALEEYLLKLGKELKNKEHWEAAHEVYCLLIKLNPNQLGHLAERSLIRKKLGHYKMAMVDLKRYFSFIDEDEAAPHLKVAYLELKSTSSHSTTLPN